MPRENKKFSKNCRDTHRTRNSRCIQANTERFRGHSEKWDADIINRILPGSEVEKINSNQVSHPFSIMIDDCLMMTELSKFDSILAISDIPC